MTDLSFQYSIEAVITSGKQATPTTVTPFGNQQGSLDSRMYFFAVLGASEHPPPDFERASCSDVFRIFPYVLNEEK